MNASSALTNALGTSAPSASVVPGPDAFPSTTVRAGAVGDTDDSLLVAPDSPVVWTQAPIDTGQRVQRRDEEDAAGCSAKGC